MTPNPSYPFAVRLIGFSFDEASIIEAIFLQERNAGYAYFYLPEDNLQDPDMYLANASEWKALVALSYLGPSDVRPVLLIGSPEVELPYSRVPRPVQPDILLEALDKLIECRADTLSRLEASDVVTVPERRRKDRLDLDLTDPEEYLSMRRTAIHGGVLIVDKNPLFSEHVGELLARRKVSAKWTDNEQSATDLCIRQRMAMVMINTSTPGVDPYRLCEAMKTSVVERMAVILLIGKGFAYDQVQARRVDCDGFLYKPLTNSHLISVLKKFLPQAR